MINFRPLVLKYRRRNPNTAPRKLNKNLSPHSQSPLEGIVDPIENQLTET
jgi:hypothetical protein